MSDLELKIKNQAIHIKQLEELIHHQKHALQMLNEATRKKNLELDALHYVWCNGGCAGGIHRFKENVPITEELVRTAEYNTIRLRTWLMNTSYKRTDMSGNVTYHNMPNGKHIRVRKYWKFVLWLAGLSKKWM